MWKLKPIPYAGGGGKKACSDQLSLIVPKNYLMPDLTMVHKINFVCYSRNKNKNRAIID